jgi:phage shock protein E
MTRQFPVALLGLLALPVLAAEIPNRLIDYPAFEKHVGVVGELRAARRVSEEEFLRMAAEPGTVVLDARSREKFDLLHVRGARNLSLPDITAEELARIIPSKDTRVLIYCNNNFVNEPRAFPTKAPAASLNLHTINVLYAYGYLNVFELGPLLDVRNTRIEFEGTDRPGA